MRRNRQQRRSRGQRRNLHAGRRSLVLPLDQCHFVVVMIDRHQSGTFPVCLGLGMAVRW
ncbi:MAG TPA: hypothetical protein VJ925_03850 [Longimicrobiales bacterium]|nr:hypothetical protein [Longimicrobiales bacterium]